MIDFWYIDTEAGIAVETYPADSFAIDNLYAQHYGSYEPTWIYRYTREGAELPVFEIREYYDGSYEAWLTADSRNAFEECVKPLLPETRLERIAEYPQIPSLTEFIREVTPEDLPAVLDGLAGRFFLVEGKIEGSFRSHYDAYEAFSKFPEGFRETVVLDPLAGPGGLLVPEITTPLIPIDADEADWRTLPSPFVVRGGADTAGIACIARYKGRLRAAREGPESENYTLRFELVRRLP